jgi:hypothetical protein
MFRDAQIADANVRLGDAGEPRALGQHPPTPPDHILQASALEESWWGLAACAGGSVLGQDRSKQVFVRLHNL